MNKNLAIRTAVAAVAIPIILWICYQGGVWLWGMVTLFAIVAASEFLIAEGHRNNTAVFWFGHIAVVIMMLISAPIEFGNLPFGFLVTLLAVNLVGIWPFPVLFLLCGVFLSLRRNSPEELFRSFSRLMWGGAYLLFLYPCVFWVGNAVKAYADIPGQGGDWLLFLFGLLWLGDTAAMFVGRAFGKHKLAPTVSPNKTVEGFIGGIVGAIIVAVILGFWRLDMIPMWQLVITAILCSIFGQLGDLVESMWKRSLGIKDSSAIIPGHGGVLDRFDSLLFAAPVMYYAMVLIGK